MLLFQLSLKFAPVSRMVLLLAAAEEPVVPDSGLLGPMLDLLEKLFDPSQNVGFGEAALMQAIVWLATYGMHLCNLCMEHVTGVMSGSVFLLGGGRVWRTVRDLIAIFLPVATALYSTLVIIGWYQEIMDIQRLDWMFLAKLFIRLIVGNTVILHFEDICREIIVAMQKLVRMVPSPTETFRVPDEFVSSVTHTDGWLILLLILIITLIAFLTIVLSGFGLIFQAYRMILQVYLLIPLGVFAAATVPLKREQMTKNFFMNLIAAMAELIMFLVILKLGMILISEGMGLSNGLSAGGFKSIVMILEMTFGITMIFGLTAASDRFVRRSLGVIGW